MIYMAADNNLEKYAIQDINELERVGSSDAVSVVVEIDRTPGYDSSNGDWTTTRRYYIRKDYDDAVINSELIADIGEQDMADPANLSEFIHWTIQAYPAKHYMLVLWDHGRGWQTLAVRTLSIPMEVKALNIDDTNQSEMSLAALREGLIQSPYVDMVVFDACLMGMLEVAYSIRDCADIMVASEDNIPATGQPYEQVLSKLVSSPQASPYEVSRQIIDSYMGYYSTYTGTLTYSAISLPTLDTIVQAVDELGRVLSTSPDQWPLVRKVQSETQYFDFEKKQYVDYKDLYDFASRLNAVSSSPTINTACQSVMTSLDRVILYQRNSGGRVANAHGISVYIPPPDRILSQYETTDFARDTSWDEFLRAY